MENELIFAQQLTPERTAESVAELEALLYGTPERAEPETPTAEPSIPTASRPVEDSPPSVLSTCKEVKRTNSLLESYIMNSKNSTSMGEEKWSSTYNLENSPNNHLAQWEERVMEVVMDYEKIFEWMIAWSLLIFSTNTEPSFILDWRVNKTFIRHPP